MDVKRQAMLDALVDHETAKERVMLERVLYRARDFYANPDNVRAFEAWQKQKQEGTTNAADHHNV